MRKEVVCTGINPSCVFCSANKIHLDNNCLTKNRSLDIAHYWRMANYLDSRNVCMPFCQSIHDHIFGKNHI